MSKEEQLFPTNPDSQANESEIETGSKGSHLRLVLADLRLGEIYGDSGKIVLEQLIKLSEVEAPREAVQRGIAAITRELLLAGFDKSQKQQDVLLMPIMRAGVAMWDTANQYFGYPETSFLWGTKEKGTDQASVIWLKQNGLNRPIIILDPIIATGDTIVQAYSNIASLSTDIPPIAVLSCYAAPQGVQAILDKTQNIDIFVGCMAQAVGRDGYLIPPTNGDMGDKLYGKPAFNQ